MWIQLPDRQCNSRSALALCGLPALFAVALLVAGVATTPCHAETASAAQSDEAPVTRALRHSVPDLRQGSREPGSRKPKSLTRPYGAADAIATLDAFDYALHEVVDGATYVWHRSHGRLSGFMTPLRTFRGTDGRVCRTIKVEMVGGGGSRKTTGTACRTVDGTWRLGMSEDLGLRLGN